MNSWVLTPCKYFGIICFNSALNTVFCKLLISRFPGFCNQGLCASLSLIFHHSPLSSIRINLVRKAFGNNYHLMTGPEGNSEFCFWRISLFPLTSSQETLRFEGNKIRCSPRDQSLSDLLYSETKHKQMLKNALRFQRQHQAISDHVQQRSTFRRWQWTVSHLMP